MSFGGFGTFMIALFAALLLSSPISYAISADPNFGVSQKDRLKYQNLALRSVVAVQSIDSSRRCSGTLISPSQVLTSAHCFDTKEGQPPATFQVYLMKTPLLVERTVQVKNVHVHPLWPISRKGIALWNSSLRKMYETLNQISRDSGQDCPIHKNNWENTWLQKYFEMTAEFVASQNRPKDSCAKAILRVHKLLGENRNLLDQNEISLRTTGPGDLAIVDLKESIVSDFYRPMAIDWDFKPLPKDDRLALISGFGPTDEKSEMNYPVNSLNVGYTGFRGMAGSDLLTISGSAVICPGDSGGPTAYVKHDHMILVGVNAGTSGCNFVGGLSHATVVGAHADWLKSIIISNK
jgi:hypothetical protein